MFESAIMFLRTNKEVNNMHKYKRHEEIVKLVQEKGTVRISELVSTFHITDMTARRDLSELEKHGLLTKIHGGARSNKDLQVKESSHQEKHDKNTVEKSEIARKASQLIEEGDTIFLGPGTTVEQLASEITTKNVSVVTNCYPVFKNLYEKRTDSFKVYLLGGEMRQVTESFVGEITNTILEKMKFSKVFFSGNAVKDGVVMTSSFAEAFTQQLAIRNSLEKYLLIDTTKIGKEDFTSICHLNNLSAIITDTSHPEKMGEIQGYTKII